MLLLSGCSINYIDRVVLSVSARPIAQEFHLSTVQLGYLFSAFLCTYLVFVLPWGVFVDRIGTKRSTAIGMAIWSLATVLTAVSGGFFTAFLSRLLMGFGESSTYPAGARTIREWIPAQERGFATAVFNCGGYLGPAVGSILIGYLVQALGWRGGFWVCAGIGFTWSVVWWNVYRLPEQASFIDAQERDHIIANRGGSVTTGGGAPLFILLRSRTLWGLFIVHGCATYMVYLFLSWLPSYLQATRDLTILKTGFYTAVPYAVAVPGTMLVGWLSDRMLRNAPVNSGRRRNMVALMLLCSSCILITPWVSNIAVILALFSFALTSVGSSVGLNIALLNDSLPDSANVGRAAAFLVTGANLFGIVAPIVTGYVVSGTGSYDAAFVIAGVLLVVGAIVSLTMTRKPILCSDNSDPPAVPATEASVRASDAPREALKRG
ncbi:MFS transporter [Caballeronia sp. dw_19]|uniref:MFS transporter n=1 Tax=Caballeronia sp. dw_19 TaxID=2719791 RepID=UPI001BD4D09E|nr:MFS transporter [Caballeronia sp. dw_19]